MAARINVRSLRDQGGWTQEQIASRLGVSVRTIRDWETAGVSPSPLALKALGVLRHELGEGLSDVGRGDEPAGDSPMAAPASGGPRRRALFDD